MKQEAADALGAMDQSLHELGRLFKPVEWMRRHPGLTAGVVVGGLAVVAWKARRAASGNAAGKMNARRPKPRRRRAMRRLMAIALRGMRSALVGMVAGKALAGFSESLSEERNWKAR